MFDWFKNCSRCKEWIIKYNPRYLTFLSSIFFSNKYFLYSAQDYKNMHACSVPVFLTLSVQLGHGCMLKIFATTTIKNYMRGLNQEKWGRKGSIIKAATVNKVVPTDRCHYVCLLSAWLCCLRHRSKYPVGLPSLFHILIDTGRRSLWRSLFIKQEESCGRKLSSRHQYSFTHLTNFYLFVQRTTETMFITIS